MFSGETILDYKGEAYLKLLLIIGCLVKAIGFKGDEGITLFYDYILAFLILNGDIYGYYIGGGGSGGLGTL